MALRFLEQGREFQAITLRHQVRAYKQENPRSLRASPEARLVIRYEPTTALGALRLIATFGIVCKEGRCQSVRALRASTRGVCCRIRARVRKSSTIAVMSAGRSGRKTRTTHWLRCELFFAQSPTLPQRSRRQVRIPQTRTSSVMSASASSSRLHGPHVDPELPNHSSPRRPRAVCYTTPPLPFT